MNVGVGLADRQLAPAAAHLNREAAIAGYGHIFPDDAPPPTYEELLEQWRFWLGPDWDRGRRAYAAHVGHELVGVVLAGPDPQDADVGHLARLYVEPSRWGHGIGAQLYEAGLDHLRGAGFTTATLWVLEHNHRARSWYERLGWRPTGERRVIYAPAEIDDLQYSLLL